MKKQAVWLVSYLLDLSASQTVIYCFMTFYMLEPYYMVVI